MRTTEFCISAHYKHQDSVNTHYILYQSCTIRVRPDTKCCISAHHQGCVNAHYRRLYPCALSRLCQKASQRGVLLRVLIVRERSEKCICSALKIQDRRSPMLIWRCSFQFIIFNPKGYIGLAKKTFCWFFGDLHLVTSSKFDSLTWDTYFLLSTQEVQKALRLARPTSSNSATL